MGYINPGLDPAAIRDTLTRRRRVLIRDFFEAPVVEALANALAAVDWSLLYRDETGDRRLSGEELRALSTERRTQISAGINELAGRTYQFSFYSHPIVHTAQRGESDLLSRFVRWMADEEFLSVMRNISGLQDIDRVYAQGTLYARGSFLNVHNDEVEVENRRLAYVINLTPRWRPPRDRSAAAPAAIRSRSSWCRRTISSRTSRPMRRPSAWRSPAGSSHPERHAR